MSNVETDGILEDSVVNRSLCSDSVEAFTNLSISKSNDCSMIDDKRKCHGLNIDLMISEQPKDLHLSGRNDKRKLERNSFDGGDEVKVWSMTNGKGRCHLCDIDLTSEQLKDQHLAGRSHKKKLERNSLDGGNEVDTTPTEEDEAINAAERKDPKFCHVCELALTSAEHASQHYDGKNHRRKVDALKKDEIASRDSSLLEASSNMDDDEDANAPENNDPKFCLACELALTSSEHAKQHYEGKNHKKKVEALKIRPTLDNTAVPAIDDNETYSLDANGKGLCKVCNVAFTSTQNAQDHLKGRSHKKKMSQKGEQ